MPTPLAEKNQSLYVRNFNRFYSRHLARLEEELPKGDFSISEVRVLAELEYGNKLSATHLASELRLDPGYLSRILKKFEQQGLIKRTQSDQDGRQADISLTPVGQSVFEPINQALYDQIALLLGSISLEDRSHLISAMSVIQRLYSGTKESDVSYVLRMHRAGDIGWIIHRLSILYHQDYGWDETFEAFIAKIGANFLSAFDPAYERCWVVEKDEDVVGSVFVVRESDEVAKLRLFYIEPSLRGFGIARRLVNECIQFARSKRYKTLTLWTNDVLISTRPLYENAGFKLVAEKSHYSFGKHLIGQDWNLQL